MSFVYRSSIIKVSCGTRLSSRKLFVESNDVSWRLKEALDSLNTKMNSSNLHLFGASSKGPCSPQREILPHEGNQAEPRVKFHTVTHISCKHFDRKNLRTWSVSAARNRLEAVFPPGSRNRMVVLISILSTEGSDGNRFIANCLFSFNNNKKFNNKQAQASLWWRKSVKQIFLVRRTYLFFHLRDHLNLFLVFLLQSLLLLNPLLFCFLLSPKFLFGTKIKN